MRTFKVKKCKRVQGLSFTPDGGRLLVLGGWEASGIEIATWLDLTTGDPVRSLTFLADQFAVDAGHGRLVIGTDAYSRSAVSKLIRWYDLSEESGGSQPFKFGVAWPSGTSAIAVGAVALAGDGSRLLVAYGRQWFPRGSTRAEWSFHLADCSFDSSLQPLVTDLAEQVETLALAPDGKCWATNQVVGRRPEIHLFDQMGKPLAQFTTPGMRTGVLSFSPDGQHLAVVNGRVVVLLSTNRLTEVALCVGHAGQVNAVAFSRDSQRMLSASHDGTIRTWNVPGGETAATFDWEIGPVTAIAFAPDGLTCAAAGKGGRVVVWDVDEN